MARTASTVLVLALLGGTAAAFAMTERLKLEPTAITDVSVPNRVFSPVCGCETNEAPISFRLREASRLRVELLDADNRVVRTLADGARTPAGPVELAWDATNDRGLLVADGAYRPRVELEDSGRTIRMPLLIRVDTVRPRVTLTAVRPRAISPDGDGRFSYAQIFYRLSERATAVLYVDGRQWEEKLYKPLAAKFDWFARRRGRGLAAGDYAVSVGAIDLAGNHAERTPPVAVRVRYTRLARERIVTRAGARFRVRVVSDAKTYRWRFAGRSGVAAPGPLVLRAPSRAGRYALFVGVNGRGDRGVVVVRRRR